MSTVQSSIDDQDTLKILVSTDNHLGYGEGDKSTPDRGNDSFNTFEEILQLAKENEVDFILLGGDLFHDNKPSRQSMHKCISLIRKYCFGDKPVNFELISDQKDNFKHQEFQHANYMDHNLNISMPIFSIHGNHDDPAGRGQLCVLDILSAAGLVNYFGKCPDLNDIEVYPLLFKKGTSQLAIYGMGCVRDERLHRLFTGGKVQLLRPEAASPEEWFNIMVLHQNRAKHSNTNYIPENFLDDFLDLIIWGHEHECLLTPEWNGVRNFYVSQPGSSVATSLSVGEARQKHVGLLEINKKKFKMTRLPLQSVRPFYIEDIVLAETSLDLSDPVDLQKKISDYCAEKVNRLLTTAKRELTGHPKQPTLPLVRIRVEVTDPVQKFCVPRFGQPFMDKVANPNDIVSFLKFREKKEHDKVNLDDKMLSSLLLPDSMRNFRAVDLVCEYFSKVEIEAQKMLVLSEKALGESVVEFVEKEEKDAIDHVIQFQMEKVQKRLKGVANLSNAGDPVVLYNEMRKFREERQNSVDDELNEVFSVLAHVKQNRSTTGTSNTGNGADIDMDFGSDSGEDIPETQSGRGRGRGATRARGRGSRGSASQRGTARGRGKGGRGASANKNPIIELFAAAGNRQSQRSSQVANNTYADSTDEEMEPAKTSKSSKQQARPVATRGGRKRPALDFSDDSDENPFA